MPKIVKDQINPEGSSFRAVRIAGNYSTSGINETYARFGERFARITFITDNKKPRSFSLTPEEMDSIAAQWIKFREDCISAKEAEEKRVEEVKAQAFNIAEKHPEIKIDHESDANEYFYGGQWRISMEQYNFFNYAETADDLLAGVQRAKNAIALHQQLVEKAKSLKAHNSDLKIEFQKSNTVPTDWVIHIPTFGWYITAATVQEFEEALESTEKRLQGYRKQQSEQAAQSASDSKEVVNQ